MISRYSGYETQVQKNYFFSYALSFRTQSFWIDKIIKNKRPGTSDQSLFRLRDKFRKIPFLVMYYLTKFDDVI